MRLFAKQIRDGAYLDRRHDAALPDRQPAPRPDLRPIQRPIGPVVVFGASTFPLAFATACGDTTAALAARCPVLVKGHETHPGTSEIVAEAIFAVLPIAPSTYCEHVTKRTDPARLSGRARRDAALRPEIRRVFEET